MLSVPTKYHICRWLARDLNVKQVNMGAQYTLKVLKLKSPSHHTNNQQATTNNQNASLPQKNEKRKTAVGMELVQVWVCLYRTLVRTRTRFQHTPHHLFIFRTHTRYKRGGFNLGFSGSGYSHH